MKKKRLSRLADLPFSLAAALLFGAALALYWSGLRHPLVFDDYHLSEYALKTTYAHAAARFGVRWLSDASYGWIHALFGGDVLWQRLASVCLHAATALVLFGFFARLSGALLEDPRSRRFAFFGALLFVVHPVRCRARRTT